MGSHELLSREEWGKVAKRCLGTGELDVLDYELRRMGSEGTGFLGEHRLAKVTVQLRNGQPSKRILKFFVKSQPELPDQREIVAQTNTFEKEVGALSSLFVDLRSVLQNEGEGMEWTCKCFYIRADVIVLEDLVDMGFQLINSRVETSFQHNVLVLQALANLHAASLIYEETRPVEPYRLGTERIDVLGGGFFQRKPGHPGDEWMQASVKTVWSLVEEIYGKETLRNVKSQVEEVMYTYFEFMKPSERFRNVVCHGDLWRNNLFFRLEETEPVEVRMVDYQVIRYAPPVFDVVCFLYLTTRRAFRAEHGHRLLELYYEHLSRNLEVHELQPDKILPWQELQDSWNYYKKLGVLIAPCYNVVTHIKEEDISHVFTSTVEYERFLKKDRSPEAIHAFRTDDIFRDKVTEVIGELFEECTSKTI